MSGAMATVLPPVFLAGLGAWRDRALCRGLDASPFFSETKDKYPPDDVQALCNVCPVRAECLAEALRRKDPWGVWGGTSGWQRMQILRGKARRRCLMCHSDNIRRGPGAEVCMACGITWSTPTG